MHWPRLGWYVPFGEWRSVDGYTSQLPRSFVGRLIGELSVTDESVSVSRGIRAEGKSRTHHHRGSLMIESRCASPR